MSATQQALPDSGTAYNHLFTTAHARVFFTKLASVYGYPSDTPEAQQELLHLAGRLRTVNQAEKQAAASPYGAALSSLDQVMGGAGMNQAARHQEQEMAIKQAAAELATDPMVYNSVLALKAQEAAAVAEQMGL